MCLYGWGGIGFVIVSSGLECLCCCVWGYFRSFSRWCITVAFGTGAGGGIIGIAAICIGLGGRVCLHLVMSSFTYCSAVGGFSIIMVCIVHAGIKVIILRS